MAEQDFSIANFVWVSDDERIVVEADVAFTVNPGLPATVPDGQPEEPYIDNVEFTVRAVDVYGPDGSLVMPMRNTALWVTHKLNWQRAFEAAYKDVDDPAFANAVDKACWLSLKPEDDRETIAPGDEHYYRAAQADEMPF